ncbi:class I SAM-dependent methyltransferase [Pseudoxanthomonas sp. z9]|uniref:class I SAM-dependent methyltransferase n=1 Tax=Pseudoxanthomonas sp. z9 TaxID=2584942 RepID=UPI0015E88F42|nr:class I SAM-dependent methyltransferase [Pseudoxanthomonas sp. z9]
MASIVPPRIRWAVDGLGLSSWHRVLEIGCGNGASCTPICERTGIGQYLGIDRSEKMIAAARHRNAAWMASGVAVFECIDAALLEISGTCFDRILAINVNLFWRQADATLERLYPLLAPEGQLHLVFEPPRAAQITDIAHACMHSLSLYGFRSFVQRREDRYWCVQAVHR